MGMLKNLLQGNLAIHQEMINKFLKKLIEESNTLNKLNISITEGLLNLTAEILAGLGTSINVKIALSINSLTFNRHNRLVEFQVNGPVLISLQGIEIRARLGINLDPDPAGQTGAPSGLVNALQYLEIKEDKITVNFNKIPGFNQLLQKKLGFLLNYLEINKIELIEEMLIVHPSMKL
ncbi:MAG TPA: hypothetical protein GXZ25_06035 [Peptococcaceae bacterium]|nr:hypothetical protein [Bacillota bacterium]HHU86352.1 hypothetical protein [Peptococcaceae bacterium]